MDILYLILSSLVQSLTEFLPISSSGHLLILHYFWAPPLDDFQLDVVLHFGSALALLFFFRHDIVVLLRAWFKSFSGRSDAESRLVWYLIVSTLPAGILGFLANDFITEVFRSPVWVIIMLVVVAIVFILVERYARAEQDLKSLNFSRALLIGLAQCLALIPGVSRSGITIAAAMGVKIKRAEAARYSFLLAIPTILGASVSELATIASQGTSTNNIIKLGIGLVICFVFSFYVIKYFLNFLRNHSLQVFAWYRIALALVLLLILTV